MSMSDAEDKPLDRLRRARAITGAHDARKLYADWAEHYDNDIYDALGITGSARIAELLQTHCAPHPGLSVLDAGCGTGMLGKLLHERGYGQIDGLDISPEMLAVARRKQVYRHLADADLNHAFSAPVPAYGAIVSAGTFVHGHVGATGFRQLFDLLKPGGVMACAISMTIWQDADVARIIAALPAHTLSNTVEAVIPEGEPDTLMLVLQRRG
jgi:predicted TPR repeat methyltransferase